MHAEHISDAGLQEEQESDVPCAEGEGRAKREAQRECCL